MNYLAINTAVGAEILLSAAGAAHYFRFPEKTMTGGLLLPSINDLLTGAGIKLKDIDAFVCVTGPGSFTGIRIGVSVVRAFAYALGKPVVPVTYFDLLAYNSTASDAANNANGVTYESAPLKTPFTAVVDGGAGAAYLKNFDKENRPPFAVKTEDILNHAHKNIIADPFFNIEPLKAADRANVRVLQGDKNPLYAAAEAAIAQNKFVSYNDLVPLYLRRSQPEREAGEV